MEIMNIVNSNSELEKFIQFVATKKNELQDWKFLHITAQGSLGDVKIGEVEQFLKFQIHTENSWLLRMPDTNELLLFIHNDGEFVLTQFEKSLHVNFGDDILPTGSQGFEENGLAGFSKIIEPHIEEDNIPARIAFTRMARADNNIMVLDDDPMVLKQMEKILGDFGNVMTLKTVEDFEGKYVQHAPDIFFLDIHLDAAEGNKILKELQRNTDPYAHVIMISSDTKENLVMDIKEGGAKGFVVKPTSRDNLHKHILRSPTMIVNS